MMLNCLDDASVEEYACMRVENGDEYSVGSKAMGSEYMI